MLLLLQRGRWWLDAELVERFSQSFVAHVAAAAAAYCAAAAVCAAGAAGLPSSFLRDILPSEIHKYQEVYIKKGKQLCSSSCRMSYVLAVFSVHNESLSS